MAKQDSLCVAKNVMRDVSMHHEVDVVTSLEWHGSHVMCKKHMHDAYLSCAQQCRRNVLFHGVYVVDCVSFCVHGLYLCIGIVRQAVSVLMVCETCVSCFCFSTDLNASPVAACQNDAMTGRAFEGALLEVDGNTDMNKVDA